MSDIQGIKVYEGVVQPDWIDINGHMNVAYYLLAFDLAVDGLWSRIGINTDYIESTRGSTFAVESHITWQRELNEGDTFFITSEIIAFDEKRIHQFQRMYHAGEQFLAATGEWMNLHVNLDTRRVSPWSDTTLAALHDIGREQGRLPLPAELGSRIGIKQPLYGTGVNRND